MRRARPVAENDAIMTAIEKEYASHMELIDRARSMQLDALLCEVLAESEPEE